MGRLCVYEWASAWSTSVSAGRSNSVGMVKEKVSDVYVNLVTGSCTRLNCGAFMSNNIGVAVRVRPRLPREDAARESLVLMPPDRQGSVVLAGKKPEKAFVFDDAIWSFDPADDHYLSNVQLYHKSGPELIDHLFQGFHVCLIAYGQTSSGKTYTMMGDQQNQGFIPLLIKDILAYRETLVEAKVSCEIKVTYTEIYNETVRDLLGSDAKKLRVREHPETGPYVEDVAEFIIDSYEDFARLVARGNANRATAQTNMNDTSSRSHAILNVALRQTKFSGESDTGVGDAQLQVESNIKLVDLAGSERLDKTGLLGQKERIKEGNSINKSLTVLGRCINTLSKNAVKNSNEMVPYRDSVLTYLLRENLGGNSKTYMIFCLSPLDYDETLQTLNYADRVKTIKTNAHAHKVKLADVQIDWEKLHKPEAGVVADLKKEIAQMTEKLKQYEQEKSDSNASNMMSYLDKELEKLRFENKFLSSKLKQQQDIHAELINHNQYLSLTLRNSIGTLDSSKFQHHLHLTSQKLDYITQRCDLNIDEINVHLEAMDPALIIV